MLGTQVGNYEVTSQIGLGGMGVVYLAHHTMLSRPAAVKVLRSEMSHNRDIVSRFFNEARAATAIRHPGIVEIYDFGYLPDGSAYIIMEFLDGESLSDRIVRLGRLSVGHALAAARQIASALGAAHAQQIVHRDLKPENVFIVADPEREGGERLKLLDFGIAKLAAASGERSQTRTGEVIGTPTFMSPEQCRGAGKVDARSDLYSLGCLLYVLLCGRPPFIAEGAGDIIAHHLYFPPEPPSRHEPSLPVGVEQLVLWLLQKDPDARPATAAAVIEAIDEVIDALGASTTVSLPVPPRPRLPSQVASRPPQQAARAGQASTTLSGSASQVRARATPHTVMVRPRSRWLMLSMIGGALALGVVIAVVASGGEDGQVPEQVAANGGQPEPKPKPEPVPAPVPQPAPPPDPAPNDGSGSDSTLPPDADPSPAPKPAPIPPTPTPAPAVVQVQQVLESSPPGAKVFLGGKLLGVTPLTLSVAAESSARKYTLRKDGHLDGVVSFAKGEASAKSLLLQKKTRVAPKSVKPAKPRDGLNPFE